MKNKAHILTLMLAVLLLTGCNQLDDTGVANNTPVEVSLSFSVSNGQQKNTTRQTNDVVQPNGSETFRGLQMLRAIPFAIDGNEVTGADRQKVFEPDGSSATTYPKYTDAKIRAQFYYINECSFAPGTNAVLAYAQAAKVYDDKDRNGSLVDGIVDRSQPASEIEFRLENILPNNNAPAAATLLAAYFTDIAKTSYTSAGDVTIKWSNTDNSKLKGLFMNFVGLGATDYQPLPSSAACAKASLADLYKELTTMGPIVGSNLEEQLRQELITKTTPASDGFPAAFPEEAKNYPASEGLPDGAAVIRWYDDGQQFKPETETSTLAGITSISRYAYPAELWFCANSKIKTSYSEVSTNDYSSATDWANLLADKYTASGTIFPDTKAAAITNPLQYAVAHLKIALKNVARTDPEVPATLKDSKEEDIVVGSTKFPLTGIIVGRQYPQDYNFTPRQPISDVDESFAYDHHMLDAGGNGIYLCEGTGTTNTVNTLLLQTPSDQKKKEVSVALEFENNSDQDFYGKNGIVYKGTKFYLLAKVNPADATAPSGMPESAQAQVLTRDYITTLTLKVASLREAYNVLPDLTSARLELGVEVVTKWEQATPTEISID